jgi:hypothetical protein
MRFKTTLLVLLFLTYAVTQEIQKLQENVPSDKNLLFLEESNQDSIEIKNLRGRELKYRNSLSTQDLYNKVNARSDAYNSYSPRYNPTSQYNNGGAAAQASHQRASEIWQEIRSRESLNGGAAPAAGH